MDAKADRKQKVLIINNLHFEDVELNPRALKKLAKSIRDFVRFNSCEQLSFIRTNNKTWVQKLNAELHDIISIENPTRKKSK